MKSKKNKVGDMVEYGNGNIESLEHLWLKLSVDAATSDIIDTDKPDHYANGSDFDVTDFVYAYEIEHCGATACKYIARKGKKQYEGMTMLESEKQDLKKAIDYLDRRIKQIEKETNKN